MNAKLAGGKRCYNIRMTDEARVLKRLRIDAGLSVRKVASILGLSHGTIVHIETGRLDVPKRERLMQILAVYGVHDYVIFYDRVRKFTQRQTPREELRELVELLSDDRVDLILKIAKRIAEGKALIAI